MCKQITFFTLRTLQEEGCSSIFTVFELWLVIYVKKFFVVWGTLDTNPITNEQFIANFESAPITVLCNTFVLSSSRFEKFAKNRNKNYQLHNCYLLCENIYFSVLSSFLVLLHLNYYLTKKNRYNMYTYKFVTHQTRQSRKSPRRSIYYSDNPLLLFYNIYTMSLFCNVQWML